MDIVKVKPRDGLSVVMPDRGRLAKASGENVDRENPYYAKAIEDRDLILVSAEDEAIEAAGGGEGSN